MREWHGAINSLADAFRARRHLWVLCRECGRRGRDRKDLRPPLPAADRCSGREGRCRPSNGVVPASGESRRCRSGRQARERNPLAAPDRAEGDGLALVGGLGEAQELPLHRVDRGEVCCDVVVAATLAEGQTEAAARKGLGRTCAAEMDDGGEILLLLRARRVRPVCENCCDVAARILR